MQKHHQRIKTIALVGLICATFFLGCGLILPQPTPATVQLTAINQTPNKDLYFGRNQLLGVERYWKAYDAITDGIAQRKLEINLSSYNLSNAEFERIFEFYRFDHAEHYWLPNSYTKPTAWGRVQSLGFASYLTANINDTVFEQKAAEYFALVAGMTSEYEIALTFHDALVRNVEYLMDAVDDPENHRNAFSAYGAIVDGAAVCEGYAEAYQYLLHRCGIQSYLVTGTADGVNHEWNIVRLDGQYYYTDVTWDDPIYNDPQTNLKKPIFHAYFNITTERLREDHNIRDTYDVLPPCTDESMMHHEMLLTDEFNNEEIAKQLRMNGNKGIIRIYYTGDSAKDDFESWFTNGNLTHMFNLTDLRYYPWNCQPWVIGREYLLEISCTATRNATSIALDNIFLEIYTGAQDQLTATIAPTGYCSDPLVWSTSDPTIVRVIDGKLYALQPGTATITAKAGNQTATCEVTVTECTHDYDLTAPVWQWSTDYQQAYLETTCNLCHASVHIPAEVTRVVTTEPTTETPGVATCTAKVVINETEYTDEQTVELPPLPEPFSWNRLWNDILKLFSFGGIFNGYIGLAIVFGGGIVIYLITRAIKRK